MILTGIFLVPAFALGQETNVGPPTQAAKAASGNACAMDASIRVDGGGCYSTVSAAISALPSSGGTVFIPAGTYACPRDIISKTNIQLIGQTFDPPAATGHGINSSWLSYSDTKVVFQCTSTWTIDSSNGLVFQGIQIQTVGPQLGDGVLLEGVTNSRFESFSIVGQGSGQAGIGLHIIGRGTRGTNSSRNTFQDFLIAGFNNGAIALNGSSSSTNCVTANEFRDAWLTSGAFPTGPAIGLGYCADSNYWYNITATNLGNSQSALVVNDTGNRSTDEDSGGNGFFGITVQPATPANYTGPLFQFNQSQGTLIDGASITGGLAGNIDGEIVGTSGSPQFRVCFASNFSMPSYSSSCIDQVSYVGMNDALGMSKGIGATALYSIPPGAPGFYRVYGEMWTASLGTGDVTFSVSSNIGGYIAGQNTAALSLASRKAVSFSFDVFAAGGTNITYQTSYTPSGSYGLRIRITYEPQGN